MLDSDRGVYVLFYTLQSPLEIVTKNSRWFLEPEVYLYFGSARGRGSTSLKNRIKRHMSINKTLFWHIDYLTSSCKGKISQVWYSTHSSLSECKALRQFVNTFASARIISHFGSSDCQNKCGSHLVQLDLNLASNAAKYFKNNGWQKLKQTTKD
ncbi:MAG: GIY-YIG nuclease family protein [Candidatus Hodarchaeales archaeon]